MLDVVSHARDARDVVAPVETVAPAIAVDDLVKRFGAMVAVDAATIRVQEGQLVALLGPSGSGKTTLLRMIAGFERPDAGAVSIAGHVVAGPDRFEEPDRRRVGMVFQHGALFPHLTVADNVAFGASTRARADECLDLVALGARATSHPHELSGGERQRVALARALAHDPDVVLLDEPFSSLDAAQRETLREEVAGILRTTGVSTLLVTHDQAEALSLADVVVVMRQGRIEQVGTPDEIYGRPLTRWVAEFLGDADVLPGVAADGLVECELGRFEDDTVADGAVDVVIRPEWVRLADEDEPIADAVGGEVVRRSFYGHDELIHVRLDGGRALRSRRLGGRVWRPGDRVRVVVEGPLVAVAAEPTVEAGDQPSVVGGTAR